MLRDKDLARQTGPALGSSQGLPHSWQHLNPPCHYASYHQSAGAVSGTPSHKANVCAVTALPSMLDPGPIRQDSCTHSLCPLLWTTPQLLQGWRWAGHLAALLECRGRHADYSLFVQDKWLSVKEPQGGRGGGSKAEDESDKTSLRKTDQMM